MEAETAAKPWSGLSWDVVELILSYLSLRSAVVAGAVCRQWRAVLTDPSFARRAGTTRRRKPWLFICGQNNVVLHKNQVFGFDPEDGEWVALPPFSIYASDSHVEYFAGAGGFLFATASAARFCYAPLLSGAWRETPPLFFSRYNPLVGVFDAPGGSGQRFIVVGGARFVGGLVDIEDRLAVEIYDPRKDSWELFPPLPTDFRQRSSSQWLSSAIMGSRFFFLFGIYSCFIAAFDLSRRVWTSVRTLRPPGVIFAFLLACGERLVLAGLCALPDGPPCFTLWAVDHRTMAFAQIGMMPNDMLTSLVDAADDESRFASLKCVGLDGLVYVFNGDQYKAYPACICEISDAADEGDEVNVICRWKKVPPLPGVMNRFHKVIAFCSSVPLQSVLGGEAEERELQ